MSLAEKSKPTFPTRDEIKEIAETLGREESIDDMNGTEIERCLLDGTMHVVKFDFYPWVPSYAGDYFIVAGIIAPSVMVLMREHVKGEGYTGPLVLQETSS